MANLSLSAVSVGVFSKLNVSGLNALVGTRIYDQLPRNPTYPLVLYSVDETEARGMGTSELPEIDLRVSVLSTAATGAEGQAIVAKLKDLLKDAALTVTGYAMAGKVVWRETIKLGMADLNGTLVTEWVVLFSCYLEAA